MTQKLFQNWRQAIPGEKSDQPKDLEKSIKTGRLPATPREKYA